MRLYDNKYYLEDIRQVSNLPLPWNKLEGKSIMITGSTGLIGSFFIDVILEKNKNDNLNCKVYALGRDIDKARQRFGDNLNSNNLKFISYDVKCPLNCKNLKKVDFVMHLASNTHPLLYSTDPIGTIDTNIIGAKNMLDFAINHSCYRFIFASSNEIYGENRGDVELFDEDYCGYINCNTLRACYPESKRCGEALCQAYKEQKDLNIGIARFTRTYGPTMFNNDTKAISQFIKKGINNENIILKSSGFQYYSYTYMMDAVSGLFYILLKGENGEAYNISDTKGDITLRDLASYIADLNKNKVIYEIPDKLESNGYSVVTKARLDGRKLKSLGWSAHYDIKTGVNRTIQILKFLIESE